MIIDPFRAGSFWAPDVVSPEGWYDASDPNTITVATGVSVWADRSDNGLDLAQSTTTDQPTTGVEDINGLNALGFDGSDDIMETASNPFGATINDAHVFVVSKALSASAQGTLFSLSGSTTPANRWQSHHPWSTGLAFFDCGGTSAPNRLTGHAITLNEITLTSFNCTTTDDIQEYWQNGVKEMSDASGHAVTTVSNIFVGSDKATFQNVAIGEIIIINGTISTATREKCEGYLAHKWGLLGDLVGGHPYEDVHPTR